MCNAITVHLGLELFSFRSEVHWANKGQSWYRTCGVPSHRTIAIDAAGRVCVQGKEFMRATAEGTYPIRVFEI
jgi:hypothetical protein